MDKIGNCEANITKLEANVLEQQSNVLKDIFLIQDLLLKEIGLFQESPVIEQLKMLTRLVMSCENVDIKKYESIIDDVRKDVSAIFGELKVRVCSQNTIARDTIDICNNQEN